MLKLTPFLLLCSLITCRAEAQQRKYVNDYLNIGVGGRGLGMSGAQSSTVSDVTSPFWNPAGIAGTEADFQLGYMHSEYFSGIAKYDYLGAAMPLRSKKGVIGISLIRYAIDDIPYTLNLIQPDGSVDYSKIKAISSQDYAGLITYARTIDVSKWIHRSDLKVNAGGNLKIISRTIGSMANAWGAGIDLGLQASSSKWKASLLLKDATTTYTLWSFSFTDKEKQVLAQTGNEIVSRSSEVATPRVQLGLARSFRIDKKMEVLAECNADITTDGKRYGNLINVKPLSVDPRIGLELAWQKLFFIRAGAGNFQRILDDEDSTHSKKVLLFQPSVGLGVQLKSFSIDYAFTSLNLKDNPLYSHFISLKLDIHRKNSKLSDSDKAFEKKAGDLSVPVKR